MHLFSNSTKKTYTQIVVCLYLVCGTTPLLFRILLSNTKNINGSFKSSFKLISVKCFSYFIYYTIFYLSIFHRIHPMCTQNACNMIKIMCGVITCIISNLLNYNNPVLLASLFVLISKLNNKVNGYDVLKQPYQCFNNHNHSEKRKKIEWKSSSNKLFYEMNLCIYTCAVFIFAYLLIYLIYYASSEIYVLYALHFPYFLLNVLSVWWLMMHLWKRNCVSFNSLFNVFASFGRKVWNSM